MPNPVGIMTIRDVRGVGLNPKHRHIMTDKLRSLFSNEWLEGLNDDQIFSNIHKYGNTTAATIPIALSEAVNAGKISNGDIVVFAAFGSGFTWASAAIKW